LFVFTATVSPFSAFKIKYKNDKEYVAGCFIIKYYYNYFLFSFAYVIILYLLFLSLFVFFFTIKKLTNTHTHKFINTCSWIPVCNIVHYHQ